MPLFSAPPARVHEEVQRYPHRGAVTDVTPQETKEYYKAREFQFLDLLSSLRTGAIPANDDLLAALESLRDVLALATDQRTRLSADGRAVVTDLDGLLATLGEFVAVKNQDEILQKLAFHAALAARGPTAYPGSHVRPETRAAAEEARRGASALGTLVRLILTSAEYRAMLADIVDIVRDVYGETAVTKVKGAITDSYGGGTYGGGKHARRPSLRESIRNAFRDVASSVRGGGGNTAPASPRSTARDSAFMEPGATAAAAEQQPYDPVSASTTLYGAPPGAPPPAPRAYETTNEGVLYAEDRGTTRSRYASVRTAATERERVVAEPGWGYDEPDVVRSIPPEQKVYMEGYGRDIPPPMETAPALEAWERDRDRTYTGATATTTTRRVVTTTEPVAPVQEEVQYVREEVPRPRTTSFSAYGKVIPSGASRTLAALKSALPESHRRRLVRRLKGILRELAANPEYQESLEYLFSSVMVLAQSPGLATTPRHVDANVYSTALELKRLLEAMAGHSLAPLMEAIFRFTTLVRADPHLRHYLFDLRDMAQLVMRDPNYIDSSDFSSRLAILLDRGRGWAATHEARDVMTESLAFMDALRRDRITSALARDVTLVTRSLLYEDSGRLTFKGDLINDFRVVFLPALVAQMKYIALPRIEHRDETMDLILDNLILTSDNFLPNIMDLEMVNRASISPRNEIEDRYRHFFTINAHQIQADIHDVSFYYKKKTGFPKIKDWGVADLTLAGQGIEFVTTFEYDRWGTLQTLIPLRVEVKVDDLRVQIHHSKHDALYKLVSPAITTAVRRTIVTTLERTILDWFTAIDEQMTGLKKPARRGRARHAPSFVRRFVPGFMRRSYGDTHAHGHAYGHHRARSEPGGKRAAYTTTTAEREREREPMAAAV
ncbi:hypothetical protein GGF32_005308 [Allomyces javanicus]|nr:hypothetical protein GGF32_005308 [Allomyces javanicus]